MMKLYRIARDSAVALAQRYIGLWCFFLFAIPLVGITLNSSRKDLRRRAFAGAGAATPIGEQCALEAAFFHGRTRTTEQPSLRTPSPAADREPQAWPL